MYLGNPVPTTLSSFTTGNGPSEDYILMNIDIDQDVVVTGFIVYAVQAGVVQFEVNIIIRSVPSIIKSMIN